MLNSITPNSSHSLPPGESACLIRCVGGGAALHSILALSKGYPTVLTYSTMPGTPYVIGQMLKLSAIVVVGGTSSISSTYQRIKWVDVIGLRIALDVDSGADVWDTFTSGSTTPDVVYDEFGTVTPAELVLSGTITNIWADQSKGLKPNTTPGGPGNPTTRNTTNQLFAMPATGRVAFSFTVTPGATPANSENYFCLNRDGFAGNNSAAGVIYIGYYGGTLNPSLIFLPKTGTDPTGATTGTTSTVLLGVMTAGTQYVCQWIIDFDTDTIYGYRNGVYITSAAIDRTNSTGNPVIGQGAVFFGALNSAAGVTNPLNGSATTSSATVIRDCLLWKTSKSLTDVVRVMSRFGITSEFPTYLL